MCKIMEFDWVHTWLGDEGMPVLAEDKAQGLLSQVFWSFKAYPSLFYIGILFFTSCL